MPDGSYSSAKTQAEKVKEDLQKFKGVFVIGDLNKLFKEEGEEVDAQILQENERENKKLLDKENYRFDQYDEYGDEFGEYGDEEYGNENENDYGHEDHEDREDYGEEIGGGGGGGEEEEY